MIRVILPPPLQTLTQTGNEVELEVEAPATQRTLLDALESRYPMLQGTIRNPVSLQRRPLVRFFASQRDLTHQPPDAPLPDEVTSGAEPVLVVLAIAGG